MSQFQTQVNITPAPGVAGDRASTNPVATVDAGEGSLLAGSEGVTVGLFAWIGSDGYVHNYGSGAPSGFVAREQQALITTYLAEYGNVIPGGSPVTLFSAGDFWAKNSGTATASRNDAVYIDNGTGLISTGSGHSGNAVVATGSVAANVLPATGSSIAAITCTASIADAVMTVTAVSVALSLSPGQVLTGTGVATGTTILSQITGTKGSTGTYQVSIGGQVVASTTITASGAVLTAATPTSGTVWVGGVLSGGAIVSGTKVLANISGSGAAGTYWIDTSQTVSATGITISGGTMTITSNTSGTFAIGDVISGSSITSGSYITGTAATAGSNVTGIGLTGTYLVSVGDTAGSTAISSTGNTASSKWTCQSKSPIAVGEVLKISSYPLG